VSAARLPTVVLVGRPNVGKSTLFNRLTKTRRSIVTPVAGTTRDVVAHTVDWEGVRLSVVDTGGLFGASEDPLHELVVERGRRALAEADLIVFVVDGRVGLIPGDQEIAERIRATGHPVVLAVNKVDDRRARDGAADLHRLGFESVFEISAEHGQGVGDLLDEVVRLLPRRKPVPTAEAPLGTAVAIVGRPNAGKSSLVNRLLREERMIVSEVPGTTRDAVDTVLMWHGEPIRLVDTAGIRRPGRVVRGGAVESLSVLQAERAMERADVVVLVIDSTEGPTDQDGAIAGAALERGCSVIIAANKWDLMKAKGPHASKAFDEQVRFHLKFLEFAPILHISALTGERSNKVIETVEKAARARQTRIPTGELNRFLERVTSAHAPVTRGRRTTRLLYATQVGVSPPTFVMFTNTTASLHFSYVRYLENQLRSQFDFFAAPIRLSVRAKAERRRARTT
jgi:GTP-binding protein